MALSSMENGRDTECGTVQLPHTGFTLTPHHLLVTKTHRPRGLRRMKKIPSPASFLTVKDLYFYVTHKIFLGRSVINGGRDLSLGDPGPAYACLLMTVGW